MNLKLTYYTNVILSMNRGYNLGEPSNAKPLYLLSIICGIEEGHIIGNVLTYDMNSETMYLNICKKFEPQKIPAKFFKPFFHLMSEPFYCIKWKNRINPKFSHTPSSKFLRENVEFAFLDDDLWEMLQNAEIRENLKQVIINFYLK